MAREGVNVGNQLRGAFARGGAADAAIEGNLQTSERALIRADAQQPWRYDTIEAGPARVRQPLMQDGRAGGHGGDRIVDAGEHGVELAQSFPVDRFFRVTVHGADSTSDQKSPAY